MVGNRRSKPAERGRGKRSKVERNDGRHKFHSFHKMTARRDFLQWLPGVPTFYLLDCQTAPTRRSRGEGSTGCGRVSWPGDAAGRCPPETQGQHWMDEQGQINLIFCREDFSMWHFKINRIQEMKAQSMENNTHVDSCLPPLGSPFSSCIHSSSKPVQIGLLFLPSVRNPLMAFYPHQGDLICYQILQACYTLKK